MAKGANQKLKLLYLAQILMEETDEQHGLTLAEITSRLGGYDINADRKTLYADFEELRKFGMDIISVKAERQVTYHLVSRDFELPELKLLVDCVQAAKFITEKKSGELIKKLEGLASHNDAIQLQRQVLISGRIKTMNESIYYNVDKLHNAINANVQITFQYFNWNVKKEMELRHDGQKYQVSPRHLIWDDEYYYLVADETESGKTKHYRVDKMLHIELTSIPRIAAASDTNSENAITRYSRSLFGMFGGEQTSVTLEVADHLAGVIIDRFGKDTMMIPGKDGHFRCIVNVSVSPQFFGWALSFGNDIRIVSPDSIHSQIRSYIADLQKSYQAGT